jgi:hypothetical protein
VAPTSAPAQSTQVAGPTAAPTATVAILASPAPTAASDHLPAGWQRESNEQLSIALPADWRGLNLGAADAQALYNGLKQNDPQLAGIVGSAEALQGAALWAFGPAPSGPAETAFVDNLSVRRSPLGPLMVTDMQNVLDVLLPEYEKMGLQVTSTDATLRVNDHAAARITYNLTMNTAAGKPFEIRGRQVLVATDTDLWILSFSTTPEREGEMAPQFEMSAQSFEPK